jgi:hypothetical protein
MGISTSPATSSINISSTTTTPDVVNVTAGTYTVNFNFTRCSIGRAIYNN